MNLEPNRLVDLLERRISLVDSLGQALSDANADVVRFDIDGLERHIRDQERICLEIQSLDATIESVQAHWTEKLRANGHCGRTDGAAGKFDDVMSRLERTKRNVLHLNVQHRELLRRSSRTVTALLNSYRSFANTYSNPGASDGIYGERL